MHVPQVIDLGVTAVHDVACPVCQARSAQLDLLDYVFQPCEVCQDAGWRTRKRFSLRRALARRTED